MRHAPLARRRFSPGPRLLERQMGALETIARSTHPAAISADLNLRERKDELSASRPERGFPRQELFLEGPGQNQEVISVRSRGVLGDDWYVGAWRPPAPFDGILVGA